MSIHPLCDNKPCLNDGICTSDGTNIDCDCAKGFIGARCEVRFHFNKK